MPTELLALLVVVVAVGIWLDTMRQHDHALDAARRICNAQGVQLLDHTVGMSALKLRRHDGQLTLERHYAFEVSITGNDRHRGTLWMLHGRLGGVAAPWLQSQDADATDARTAVTNLLERISHEDTTRRP